MKKNSLILSILLVLFVFVSLPPIVDAKSETSGDLQVTWDDPLFPSTIVWYPGLTVTKSFTVKNIGGITHKTQVFAKNTSQTGNLANYLFVTYTDGFNTLYGGAITTMKNFWDHGTTNLSDVGGGNSTIYYLNVTMPINLGNEFQATQAKFDLTVRFEGTPSTVTISGGGGAVGGAAVVCNDTKPGSAPILQSAIAGVNSVTLTWLPASDPVSYYLVAYGVSPNNAAYGNPNVGGKGATSYTVTDLSGGVNYCFIIRAGNGCTPGDFSNQICTVPFGEFIAAAVAPGFASGVLGVATPSAQLKATPSGTLGEIKGIETVNIVNCKNCIWWQILVGELVVLLIYFLIIIKKYQLKRPLLIGGAIPTLIYILFLILNRFCLTTFFFVLSQKFYCKYFILLDIGLFAAVSFFWKKRYGSKIK